MLSSHKLLETRGLLPLELLQQHELEFLDPVEDNKINFYRYDIRLEELTLKALFE